MQLHGSGSRVAKRWRPIGSVRLTRGYDATHARLIPAKPDAPLAYMRASVSRLPSRLHSAYTCKAIGHVAADTSTSVRIVAHTAEGCACSHDSDSWLAYV